MGRLAGVVQGLKAVQGLEAWRPDDDHCPLPSV
jgi:hypothetical protein